MFDLRTGTGQRLLTDLLHIWPQSRQTRDWVVAWVEDWVPNDWGLVDGNSQSAVLDVASDH